MPMGPQRRNSIPRYCLFRTRLASRVSLPDNTLTHPFSLSHIQSLNKGDGDGEVLGEIEWARVKLSSSAACSGNHGDPVFQIPAGRRKGYNLVPLPDKTPLIKTLEAVINGFIND